MNIVTKIYNFLIGKKAPVVIQPCTVPKLKIEETLPMAEKKEVFKFEFPKVGKHTINLEVLIYSSYLKTLGADQQLSYGDWYCTSEDPDLKNGKFIVALYTKKEADINAEDIEFAANDKYVRIINQEEALNIIRSMGFGYSEVHTPIFIEPNGKATVIFENLKSEITSIIAADNLHAAHLKTAFTLLSQNKVSCEASNDMTNQGIFKLQVDGEDIEDEEEDDE